MDRRLGISAGEVTSGLAELLALVGVEVAFEEASGSVERFLLIQVNDNTLRKETELYGELQNEQEHNGNNKAKAKMGCKNVSKR